MAGFRIRYNWSPHQIPCDSVQRRLLSIKMALFMDRVCKNELLSTKRAVFMDGVCKNELLSTKRAVFMDKMWKCREFGLKDSIMWCNRGAKSKKKNASVWKSSTCISLYPEDYLFSNQFMEDLGRIYRLKKVIPDPEMYASRWFCPPT